MAGSFKPLYDCNDASAPASVVAPQVQPEAQMAGFPWWVVLILVGAFMTMKNPNASKRKSKRRAAK